MIVLANTTDKVDVVLAGAVSTNQCQCIACWRDITATPTYVAGRSLANTNDTTSVELISEPAASTQRVIDYVSVYNADTASVTVTLKYDDTTNEFTIFKGTLTTLQRLEYENGKGWTVGT